ncbi:MAG: LysR family transcriptional regulator [Pseudomonadota bacterium]
MSDRFRELAAFIAVAETGAFNAGARRLDVSPPAITRLVAALEARLGAQLLTRTTRKVAPTEAGARLLADGAPIIAALEAAEAAASGARATPRGRLTVTAPVLFGERHVAPILRGVLDAHPGMTASAQFLDRTVDLIDEGVDVAVRIGTLADTSLVARRVGAVRRVIVAAPDYIARCGAPETLEDLARRRVVASTGASRSLEWRFGDRSLRFEPALQVSSMAAAIDAALAGWGVTRALSYQVADALAAGRLVELLPGADDELAPIHLLHAEGRRASAKIRVFIDAAAAEIKRAASAWS